MHESTSLIVSMMGFGGSAGMCFLTRQAQRRPLKAAAPILSLRGAKRRRLLRPGKGALSP